MVTKIRSIMALVGIVFVLGGAVQAFAQSSPVITSTIEFEITGTVDAVGIGTITVGGQVIRITGAEIKDPITVGALVKIHLSVAADGALVAREVELALVENDDFADDGELEIVGVVEARTATSVTIGGQVIRITGAEIKDPVTVGALAKVHFTVASDGTLVAREVELATSFDDDDDDRSGHDLNDDHGRDGSGHDSDDDHDDHQEDHSGSGRGSGGDDDDDHGGHGGRGGDD